MKKRYYILFFIILLIIFLPKKVFSITSLGEYTIESYDIDMLVNEDNSFDITETITADFTSSRHRNI